jgi:purine-binding chemotaxis protein CheW
VPSLIHDIVSLLRVSLGDVTIGLPAAAVREIVRAVAITPLPGAPSIVEGAVNVRGQIVPVLDVRRRLALPSRPLSPDEFLVLLQIGARVCAMRVDDVDDLVEVPSGELESSGALSPALAGLAGVSARADGVLVIYDPVAFLTQAEAAAVDVALGAS